MKLNNKGQAILIGATVILLILAIFLPLLIRHAVSESSWSVKQQNSTKAFQLAESAVEQGYQQLTLSTITWQNVLSGGHPPGYNFDATYTDPSGGNYEIRFTSSGTSAVAVTGVGRYKNELRALQAVYALGNSVDTNAGLYAGTISGAGSPEVYWGAVMSEGDLTLTGPGAANYPFLYAGGQISMAGQQPPLGPAPFLGTRPPPDQGPGPLFQWNCRYTTPTPTPPNFTYYKKLAQQQGNICGGKACYDGGWKFSINLFDPICTVGADPKVWYVATGNVQLAGNIYLCGVLIVQNGMVMVAGHGAAPNAANIVPVPTSAWMQYQVGTPVGTSPSPYCSPTNTFCPDSSQKDEYPGDDGFHITKSTYDILAGGGGYAGGQRLLFKGYIYAAKGYQVAGGTTIYGAVETGSNASALGAGNYSIFFNPQQVIRGSGNANITRTSWQDLPGCGWPGIHPTCP